MDRIYRNRWLTLFCQHILASDVQAAKPTDEVRCDWISTLDHQRHQHKTWQVSLDRNLLLLLLDQDMFV